MYKAFIDTVNEEDKNEGGRGLHSIVLIVSGDSSATSTLMVILTQRRRRWRRLGRRWRVDIITNMQQGIKAWAEGVVNGRI